MDPQEGAGPYQYQGSDFRPQQANAEVSKRTATPQQHYGQGSSATPQPHRSHSPGPATAPQRAGRYKPSEFKHNLRVACALAPCLLVLAGAGGEGVLGVLVVGLMVSYLLDVLRVREGTLFMIWGTLLAVNFGLVVSGAFFQSGRPWYIGVGLLLLSGQAYFVAGAWATLQFKWVQLQYPGVTLAFEKLVFAATPLVCTCVLTWTIVGLFGIGNASYYMFVIAAALHFSFTLPNASSFIEIQATVAGAASASAHAALSADEATVILGTPEVLLHTTALLFLPAGLHFVVHWNQIIFLSNWDEIWGFLLLLSFPSLYLCLTSFRGSLSFLKLPPSALAIFRTYVATASLMLVLACVEVRVIFHSFTQYIPLLAPWNYILVTIALYGIFLPLTVHYMNRSTDDEGYAIDPLGEMFASLCLLGSAGAGSLAIGAPLYIAPLPLCAAAALVQYYYSYMLRDYLIFFVMQALASGWFIFYHLYFLDIHFGDLSLKDICHLLYVTLLVTMAAPGFIMSGEWPSFSSSLVIMQAILVRVVEEHLYAAATHEEGLYPPYLVVFTSLLGSLMAHRLMKDESITFFTYFLVQCIWGSKPAMLFLPSGSQASWQLFLLTVSITPPLFFFRDEQGRSDLDWSFGQCLVAFILFAVFRARNLLFDGYVMATGSLPSDSHILGVLVTTIGVALMPLATYHFPSVQYAKQRCVLLIAAGALLVLLKPPLPQWWDWIWDDEHTPISEYSDALGYRGEYAAKSAWSAWMLMGATLVGLAATTSAIPVYKYPGLRMIFSGTLGFSVGAYICQEFLPFTKVSTLLNLLVGTATTCASVFVTFILRPSASSSTWLPLVFVLYLAALPAGFFLLSTSGDHARGFQRRLKEAGTVLLAVYTCAGTLMAFCVKIRITSMLRLSKEHRSSERSLAARYRPRQLQALTPTSHPFSVKGLSMEGQWIPWSGNIAGLAAFVCANVLQARIGDSEYHFGAIMTSPILLLLNHEAVMLKGFGQAHRYFPIALSICVILVLSAMHSLLFNEQHARMTVGYVLKNLLSLFLPLPNHVMFIYLLWHTSRQSMLLLACVTPLNMPALLLTDLPQVRVLAGTAIAIALVQFIVSRNIRVSVEKFL